MSAKEYREYAEECLDWAKTARGTKERLTFLEMATTWLQAAAMAERLQPPSANGPTAPTRSVSTDSLLPQAQTPRPDQ